MRHFTLEERRTRLAIRQHLATSAKQTDVAEVAGDLIGLHGTDPASVFLAAAARLKKASVEGIEQALYDDRTIVRMLAMRRTMFVVPTGLAPIVQAAASNAVAAKERRNLIQLLEASGIASSADRWLRTAQGATLAALETRGEATAAELSKAVPQLREQIAFGEGKKWAGTVSVGTRLLFLLATEGHIVRGRPRGTWTSTQHRWVPMEKWIPGGVAQLNVDEARTELAARWLRSFGPASVTDFQWWTGWTLGETRKVIARLAVIEVDLDGIVGMALADDLGSSKPPKPWVALLPALDPTVMGWKERGWFLGEHAAALFDRSGNAGPTVWWDGRIVGGWAQRDTGAIVSRLLEDVGKDAAAAINSEAARLESWLGPRRFIPRFRTPLERELAS